MSVLEQNSRKKMMLGQDGNALFILLAVNAVIFVIVLFVKIVYQITGSSVTDFNREVLAWLQIPANSNIFLTRPWTLITYMFTQVGILHSIVNLIWLWWFGYLFQNIAGDKKLIPLYIYGGFVGGLVFLLSVNTIPALRANFNQLSLLGAGPAIMGIAIATTTLSPNFKMFPHIKGGVSLWVLTAIYVVINFITTVPTNGGSALAAVGGGVIGFLFVWQMKKGNDWGAWMINLVDWVDGLFNPDKKHQKKMEQQRLFYKSEKKPFVKTPHITQQRVDELLDKINQKGYYFLSDEEKDFLKKAANEEL